MINFQQAGKVVFDMFYIHHPMRWVSSHKEKEFIFYVGLATRRKGITFHDEIEVRSVSVYSESPHEYMLVLK